MIAAMSAAMSAALAPPPAPPRLYFDAVLQPYRSLSPSGFWLLMAVVCGASLSAGTGFLVIGAWPVCGFLGLEVVLIYLAFRLSYRGARLTETLQLSDRELVVRRTPPDGAVGEWRFQPYWLRVALDEPPRRDSRLTLSSHGRRLAIGSFLAPEERRQLARALRAALARQRAASCP